MENGRSIVRRGIGYRNDVMVKQMKENDRILETERVYLRKMNQADYESLCQILQDEETMYAYEGAFNDKEVQEWLDRQILRYQKWDSVCGQ